MRHPFLIILIFMLALHSGKETSSTLQSLEGSFQVIEVGLQINLCLIVVNARGVDVQFIFSVLLKLDSKLAIDSNPFVIRVDGRPDL
jgi:hypothetical protein